MENTIVGVVDGFSLTRIGNDDKQLNDMQRVVPHNTQAEQAVLGAILTNNDSLNRVVDYLGEESFYEPIHQKIYAAISKLADKGLVATPVTLRNYFEQDGSIGDIGGVEYLARLAGFSVAIINLESYAKLIRDLFLKRQLIDLGQDIVNQAYDNNIDIDANEQIELAEQNLFNMAVDGVSEGGFTHLKSSLSEAIQRAEVAHKRKSKISGIGTDFIDLDNLLGGLQDSDLLILAGRPSMGKTAFSVNLAVNACKKMYKEAKQQGKENEAPAVGFFSLEMSSEQLAARMIAMESAVDSSKMRIGGLRDEDFAKIVRASTELHKIPFFIDDTPALSISALRTRARRLKRRNNLGLLIVDYLQLLRGSRNVSDNRVQEVSEITQGLKAIAKELNIPVIALSQLSRAVEQREDKRPQLSDLRESGSIEQDADVVMFIFREEYYEMRKQPAEGSPKFNEWQTKMEQCANKTEIIIAKQRNGPIGTAKIFFNSGTTKFENLEER